jgi:long-chain acyl-CoA synthetase
MFESIVSRFFRNADRLGSAEAVRFHDGQTWVPIGWRASGRIVRELASGLISLGQEKGHKLAILAGTRWEWLSLDLANLAVGGVTVGVYPTLTPDQTRYVIEHSDARILVVDNAKQLAKVEQIRAQLPALQTIVVIDAAGVGTGPGRMSFQDLLARGRAARHDVEARVATLRPEDPAIFVYTSGTTGPPKGAVLTHGNITASMHMIDAVQVMRDDDFGFAFLPMAHVLQRQATYGVTWRGIPGAYGRGIETVAEDIAATHPTVMAAVPRIFEKIYGRILDQAASMPARRKGIFDRALATGREVSRRRQAGEGIPPMLAIRHALARRLVFSKLHQRLGGRIRLFLTGGAPIAREILEFFDAADIAIVEGWGMTETCSGATLNLPGACRFGTIGKPLPGVDVKLDVDGEILIRGPIVFAGYYKEEEATRACFTADGYFRTGDIAKLDADGFYTIVDRKKDLIITAAGKNVAPQNIENLMKTDPRLSQVVVIGDRRPYLVALVSVSPELREGRGDAELQAIVEEVLARKNPELAQYERIKKFRLLPQDLTQEAGELTPTLKVKRKVVTEKFGYLIDEMYAEARPAQGVAAG